MINRWIEILRGLERRQLLGLMAAVAVVVIGLIFSLVFLTRTEYSLLYGNLSAGDSAEIVGILENLQQPYRLEAGGNQIMVPRESVGRLRVAIAEQGLPSGASVGYEIFDREEGFSTSSFVQEVNRLRALEGELARTISTIDTVASVRVHLVLPKRELFSRDKQKPSASIILKLVRGRTLESRQIKAVQNIVAAAVPELEPGRISIVDSAGNLLAQGTSEDNALFQGSTPEEIKTGYESRLTGQLESLISNIVGFGNVRVEVSAEIDFSQTVINEESFDPDGQVLRSSEEITENSARVENAPEPVTVETNLPQEEVANAAGRPQITENSERTETRRNFDITTRRVNRVVSPGQVRRLSVAVLVDGTYTEDENGTLVYAARTEDQLAEIERLVKSAIGYDSDQRQDIVEVVNLQFVQEDSVDTIAEALILGIPASDFRHLVELIVLSLVAVVVFLVVIRPLLFRALNHEEKSAQSLNEAAVERRRAELIARGVSPVEATILAAASAGDSRIVSGQDGGADLATGMNGEQAGAGDSGIRAPDSHKKLIEQLNELVEQSPQETANALRSWLAE